MREFYHAIRVLRKELPGYNFKVRRLEFAVSAYGTCDKNGDVFIIRIQKNLNEDHAIHILVHELAHMLVWDQGGDDHNSAWGRAYSKVYRIFVEKYVHEER